MIEVSFERIGKMETRQKVRGVIRAITHERNQNIRVTIELDWMVQGEVGLIAGSEVTIDAKAPTSMVEWREDHG